ncbi:MAG: beta-galactosidase, partial [Armatimonadetes bacterium]|nr:beta-galactosidase [Armatimonadota bacterium]
MSVPVLRGLSLAALLLWFVSGAPASPAPGETRTFELSTAAGIHWQFRPEGGDWKDIAVPAGGWRTQGYTCDAGAYRARIPIPPGVAGWQARLVFAAVNFGAAISVGPDDAHLTPVASHVDGWVPVTADITPYAVPGAPLRVVVEVKGRRKFMAGRRYTVPEGATWDPYVEEGVLRGVSLQLLPPVHVEDVFVRTDVEHATLQPQATISNASGVSVTVTLAARLWSAAGAHFRYPAIPPATLRLAAGERRAVELGPVAWTLGPRSYWWPNVPYRPGYRTQMHILDVALRANGRTVHHYRQRFGFRQFVARGAHYYLNGVRCNLRGDNQQEADFGTDAYGVRPGFGPPAPGNGGWPRAVDNLERLNFTVMRIHQIPATPYMLDVCDEKGLMLIEESPLRGSEGGEDFQHGRDAMLAMDRELALRDRNHPATVIWSAANEWGEPIKDAVPVIQAVDDTRPIIDDGGGDLGPPYINTEHYVNGGGVPDTGGHPRADRPYGEGEAVWPNDNTRRGFAWMATGTRLRRLKNDADIRNYVLNNAWPNYVPGEGPENEILEIRVKGSPNATIPPAIADPWHDPNIRLMQQCYNPVAVCDLDFDERNKRSNVRGEWPVTRPRLAPGARVTRTLAVFNDEFSGQDVQVAWELHTGFKSGPLLKRDRFTVHIPLGEYKTQDIAFDAPQTPGDLFLAVSSSKNGQVRFTDDLISYRVAADTGPAVRDGDYALVNANSALAVGPGKYQGASAIVQRPSGQRAVWHLA